MTLPLQYREGLQYNHVAFNYKDLLLFFDMWLVFGYASFQIRVTQE